MQQRLFKILMSESSSALSLRLLYVSSFNGWTLIEKFFRNVK